MGDVVSIWLFFHLALQNNFYIFLYICIQWLLNIAFYDIVTGGHK